MDDRTREIRMALDGLENHTAVVRRRLEEAGLDNMREYIQPDDEYTTAEIVAIDEFLDVPVEEVEELIWLPRGPMPDFPLDAKSYSFSDRDLPVDFRPLERARRIKKLNLARSDIMTHYGYHYFDWSLISDTLESLDLSATFVQTLKPLHALKKLKEFKFTGMRGFFHWDELDNENFADSIESLDLVGTSFKFPIILHRYKNLKTLKLPLGDKERPIMYNNLGMDNLIESIIHLEVEKDCKHLGFLNHYQNLEKFVYSMPKDEANIDALKKENIQKSLKSITLSEDSLTDVIWAEDCTRLEHVEIMSENLIDYEPLRRTASKDSINCVRIDGPIDDLSVFEEYSDLNTFVINSDKIDDVSIIKDYKSVKEGKLSYVCFMGAKDRNNFEVFRDDGLAVCLENVSLNSSSINDLTIFKDYTKLHSLSLDGSQIKDISSLLEFASVVNTDENGNPILERIDLSYCKNIDYTDQKNLEIIESLRKKGIDTVFNTNVPMLEEEEPEITNPRSLDDYLSKDLNLRDEFVEGICSYMNRDRFSCSTSFEEQIREIKNGNCHKVFHVTTKDGKKLILKAQHNKLKAEIEQAANYYLSKHLDFIAPTEQKTPFQCGDMYLTVQDDVSSRAGHIRDITYRIGLLAKLHAHGDEIMNGEDVELPSYEIPDFMELYEEIKYNSRGKKINARMIREQKEEYDQSKHSLENGNRRTVMVDIKDQNIFGRYMIDLEHLSVGDEAIDLGFLFNDPKFIIPQEMQKDLVGMYQHFYAKEKGIDFEQKDVDNLYEKVKGAILVRGVGSIAANLIHIVALPESAKEKLVYLNDWILPNRERIAG